MYLKDKVKKGVDIFSPVNVWSWVILTHSTHYRQTGIITHLGYFSLQDQEFWIYADHKKVTRTRNFLETG